MDAMALQSLRVCSLACILWSVSVSGGKNAQRSAEQWQGGLEQFFSSVDINSDGQIEPQEARNYLGDLQLGEQDLQCMQANVDTADQGDSISEPELQRHLQSLLKVRRPNCLQAPPFDRRCWPGNHD